MSLKKVCGVRHCIYYKEKKNLTEMKVTKQYPLVLLVNISFRQVGT